MCKRVTLFQQIEIQPMTPQPLADELKQKIQAQQKAQVQNFYLLIQRLLKNEDITDIQLQKLNQKQRNMFQAISDKYNTQTKRPDQCHKLFYKRAFKYSQKKYFKKKKNHKRMMSQFYHHHFDEVIQNNGLSITNFYHPNKKTRPGLEVGHKTFNLAYVRLLLKSKSFRVDAQQYHQTFVSECLKQKDKKIKTFIASLSKIIKKQDGTKQLVRYLQSSQCKIPWSLDEIVRAAQNAQKQLWKHDQMDTNFPYKSQYENVRVKSLRGILKDQDKIDEQQGLQLQQSASNLFFEDRLQLPDIF